MLYDVMYCIVSYCIAMYYCIVFYCIALNYIVFALNCIVLYCIVLYCIVLYCIYIFQGNTNTYIAEMREVQPAITTRWIRFVPYSVHSKNVCLRVELYGCV